MNRSFSKSSAASASTASLLPTTNPRHFSDPKTYSVDSHSSTSHPPSLSEKYALSPSPASWGAPLDMSYTEPDDFLHNPDPKRDRIHDRGGTIFTARGLANVGCLAILALGIITLFAGYPIISLFTDPKQTTQGGFNLGGINATGQIPILPGNFGLIDKDTPKDAYTKKSYLLDEEFVLVFSDEFEQDGRTFWPGDDPYWEAVDLHYWATTGNGSLLLRMDRMTDPSINHDLEFRSGMIQSWNKFCFTGGLIEVMVRLPGSSSISGLWPGAWTMGNLGRAGYGASVEGLWPYSYDECDVGTLPNQTYPGTSTPIAALENGDPSHDNVLSYLPGQRLSACTCPGEPHPGPARADGTYVGRAAPEIDILEAIVENGEGHVSLSAQWAPYNAQYLPNNSSGNIVVDDPLTAINPYKGGVFQQTTSGLAATNQSCYELSGGCFTTFGFEYKPGFDDAYITWYNNNRRSWTLYAPAMQRDLATEISARPVPVEPMYIILNLAISLNFGFVDFENLEFPATMSVDYVRVYQPKDAINTGCDPKEYPTAAYIETFKEAYTNNNFTIWSDYKQPWPKNRLMPGGCD